jgi:L-aminopeptidase/D-esterase-like protein
MEKIEITELADFLVGQAQDEIAMTGCTVVIAPEGAACGVDVRGGSPGTRDTDALDPLCNRKVVHAVLLSGGSAFGLDAAGGVMRVLEEKRIGRDVGVTVVPNVSQAILFDLHCGDSRVRPDAAMGAAAAENAFRREPFRSGNYGAGTGATVGKSLGLKNAMKGGVGCAAFRHGELMAGAVFAVNCVGDILENGEIIAGVRRDGGLEFYGSEEAILSAYVAEKDLFKGNTVIGCIFTNAALTKAQAARLAGQGHNAIARAVRPAHSIYDGDTVFAMCSGRVSATPDSVGILAAHAAEAAIVDAVKSAATYGDYLSCADRRRALGNN